jgi:hypothetical protein
MVRVNQRFIILTILLILVVVNIVVLLALDPTSSDEVKDTHSKDWEVDPDQNGGDGPDIYEDVNGPDPGDGPK